MCQHKTMRRPTALLLLLFVDVSFDHLPLLLEGTGDRISTISLVEVRDRLTSRILGSPSSDMRFLSFNTVILLQCRRDMEAVRSWLSG